MDRVTTPRLSAAELDELHALCEKATPLPWRYDAKEMLMLPVGCEGWCGEAAGANDGKLMVAACNALPRLLAERAEMEKEIEEARALLRQAVSTIEDQQAMPDDSLAKTIRVYLARLAQKETP